MFPPLRKLYLPIKFFINPFLDTSLAFSDRACNIILTSTCPVLFKAIFC